MAKKIKMNEEVYIGDSNVQVKDLLGTLLWTNPNYQQEFEAQSISISNIDNYDVFEIYYNLWKNSEYIVSTKLLKDKEGALMSTLAYSYSVIRMGTRKVKIEGSNIIFREAKYITDFAQSESNNNICIPVYIVGYKTGLFS